MKDYVKFYNGTIHNNDSSRPVIGITCHKCTETWQYNKNTTYTLINILVHSGKYDSYVLRNTKTGKLSSAKRIAMVINVSITDWTDKIRASVSDNNGAIDFAELRKQLDTCGIQTITEALKLFDDARAGDIPSAYALINYMLNNNMTGKMQGMIAIGTSCKLNPHCKLNQLLNGSICQSCYAENMRKTTAYKQAFNTLVLCTYIFPDEQIPLLNSVFSKLRFESFADILNDTQVINYINIARKNSHLNTAIWTKRPAALYNVLINHFDGIKPENLSVVVSSLYVNRTADVKGKYILSSGADMVNHVFTVYTADYAIKHGISIQCGVSICIQCGLCYSTTSEYYINEILKAEQNKYYKIINNQ